MIDNNSNKDKRTIELPDYLNGQEDHVKHAWREWEALAYKIDNYPGRFQDVVNQVSKAVHTVDCKAPLAIVRKIITKHNVSKEQAEELIRVSTEIQKLKSRKGRANVKWSRHVYAKKDGDKSILGVRSAEIINMFGRYYSVEEIVKYIRKEWGLSVKYDAVMKFFTDNKSKIEQKRAEFVLRGKETRLATDAGRLELLSKLAWEFEEKFEKSKSIEYSKELRGIIEQIRKEVKGEEIRLTVDGKIDIQATITANQTLNEALSKLPINMIIIGLTAAKQRINPANIIASLTNSYYSRINGFSKLGRKEDVELPGRYIKQYDWAEIENKVKEREQEIVDVEPIEVLEEDIKSEEKVLIEDKKKKLLELLKQYKEQTT